MKKQLRNTAAGAAIIMAASLAPITVAQGQAAPDNEEDRRIAPFFHGDIDPFWGQQGFHGDINPFHGEGNSTYGDISPFWGDIDPFWGDTQPFHGDINPFWGDSSSLHGDIDPFWGDTSRFHGDIDPFWGSLHGDIDPFWGDIDPFWSEIGPFWGDINAFWGDIDPFGETSSESYADVASKLERMFSDAEEVFGQAVEAKSGQSFREGFLAQLLAEYGINPEEPGSLAALDANARAFFFLDFYDGLMGFTGVDHVDYWMPQTNWSPALSQTVGGGQGVVVGVLDFNFTGADALRVRGEHGNQGEFLLAHGDAVASLINAPMDGEGVMGLAENAAIVSYNPFDESLTTSWAGVRDGIGSLARRNASIINMSLGVPGWTFHPGWNSVFNNPVVERHAEDVLFVLAAGNDGSTQSVDVAWTGSNSLENLLIVGSVGPTGEISHFSNRPGTACLTIQGDCGAGQRLMDRFLVAPGELILANDGAGGVSRVSGTSFAAPIVSGAAALVRGNWNWLSASDTADVLLWSATDLGEDGVDPVYGWGLLNVDAALSPLDPNDLFYIDGQGKTREVKRLGLRPGRVGVVNPNDALITLFEALNDTYRDFTFSLEDILANDALTAERKDDLVALYLAERSRDDGQTGGRARFRDMRETTRLVSAAGDSQIRLFASQRDPMQRFSDGQLPFQAGMEIENLTGGHSLRFGAGEGALALNTQQGFGLFSDHRPETGGVNPILGFASGGPYMMSQVSLSPTTRLSFGASSTQEDHVFIDPFSGAERRLGDGVAAYDASAITAQISHAFDNGLNLHANYTLLHESSGMLGAQGAGPLALEGGVTTDSATFGAEAGLPFAVELSASATFARSRTTGFDSGVLALDEAAVSTAFQLTATRYGLLRDRDAARFSLIQPLHVENGALTLEMSRIADRETGEIGASSHRWALGGEREIIGEAIYAAPLGERAEFSLFGRMRLSGETLPGWGGDEASGGVRFNLDF